jgi:hypothetical protein
MLKLTYTSTGVTLEHSFEPFEATLRRRVLLGLRMGEPLGLEPISVSLLVNPSLPALRSLTGAISRLPTDALRLIQAGANQVEMQLQGYWLAQPDKPGTGLFFMNFDPDLEMHLVKVWQTSQQDASCCSS